jgi:hypothetical protein
VGRHSTKINSQPSGRVLRRKKKKNKKAGQEDEGYQQLLRNTPENNDLEVIEGLVYFKKKDYKFPTQNPYGWK